MNRAFIWVMLTVVGLGLCLAADLGPRREPQASATSSGGAAWLLAKAESRPPAGGGSESAMAYDSARGRVVLFGYQSGGAPRTWEWDGATWAEKTPAVSPPARAWYAMAYDSARGRVVLFGGVGRLQNVLADTWEWDGATWVEKTPVTSPPARFQHAMAYDSARGRVVIFGGTGPSYTSGLLGDTWEWDGATWALRTLVGPPARYHHAMAYDSARGRVVLFGGIGSVHSFFDTWEWDGTTWEQKIPAVSPPVWDGHAMAYDSARGRVVLFGGYGAGAGTWEWDGAAWVERTFATSPEARIYPTMAYDSARDRIVLFGGESSEGGTDHPLGDIWEWDGSTWLEKTPTDQPLARGDHSMAYDSARGHVVLFGSPFSFVDPDTWTWDGTAWNIESRVASPSIASVRAMTYDSARERTVLFGYGYPSGDVVAETWEWDGATWVERTPGTSPLARGWSAMAFDSARERTVLFGGLGEFDVFGDTWEWDGATWVERAPPTSPPARFDHAMTYDSARGRVVLFGGQDYYTGLPLDDTWEWDGNDWVEITSTSSPPARTGHGMAYDSARGRVVLFGGQGHSSLLGDTWEWDGITWIETTPYPSPSARAGHMVVYDSARGRAMIFGGGDASGLVGDTWEYVGPGGGCGPDGAACDDGNACTTNDTCFNGACVGGPPPSCDDGDACTADSCDPSTGCRNEPRPDPAPAYFTVSSTQRLAEMTVNDGDILKLDRCGGGVSRAVRGSTFGGLGVDGLDVRSDGNVLFSVRESGVIDHAGGHLHLLDENVYLLDVARGTIAALVDWHDLGIHVKDLDALDELPDGTIAFSAATPQRVKHEGGALTLEPQNAYRLDPAARTITLLFDGAALGLHDLDGVDVGADGLVTFSTETDVFVRGVHVRQQNAYSVSPDGQLTLRFNGENLGLHTLDDFATP